MSLEHLTKKNKEFIHTATHQLLKDGKSDQEIKAILEDILPQIEENQKKGITARGFLGAPTAWAASFTEKAKADSASPTANTNPWLMWLDTSLLFIAIVALINGLTQAFSTTSQNYGLVSILFLGFGGGGAMYLSYHFLYRNFDPKNPTRPPFWKTIAILSLSTAAWFGAYALTIQLPESLNPKVPYALLVAIGALAFGTKYALQKKYNIQSTMSPTRR